VADELKKKQKKREDAVAAKRAAAAAAGHYGSRVGQVADDINSVLDEIRRSR
jgi:hypothetical protein